MFLISIPCHENRIFNYATPWNWNVTSFSGSLNFGRALVAEKNFWWKTRTNGAFHHSTFSCFVMSVVDSGAGTCDEIRAVRKALQSHFSLITKGPLWAEFNSDFLLKSRAKCPKTIKDNSIDLFAQLKLRLSLPGKKQNTNLFLFFIELKKVELKHWTEPFTSNA